MGHFVLVHGACHGAWCWYKVKPVLEKEGHRVTAVDLAASGINMAKIEEVHTMSDYTEPLMELMESLPPEEKVILVGHSLGGLNMALVMDKFPEKISVAVFLTAHMPDCVHPPSFVLDEFYRRLTQDFWLDSQISSDQHPLMPKNVIAFGPKCMASKLYQQSPSQDLALAKLLTRHGSSFHEDLGKGKPCSEERYGTVNRVFIICGKDLTMTADFQRWMIENNLVKDVMEIEDADHMAMLSKPQEVCNCLLDIANSRRSPSLRLSLTEAKQP